MKLLEIIHKGRNIEKVQNLDITEVVLLHCNAVNNGYQQDSSVIFTFATNKSFGQLILLNKFFFFLFSTNYSIFISIQC